MLKLLFLSLALILLINGRILAEKRDSSFVSLTVRHCLTDAKEFTLSPLDWNKTDWMVFGGVSVAAAASVTWLDKPINTFAYNHHTKGLTSFFNAVEPIGNNYSLLAIGSFALHGIISKNNYSAQTAMIAAETFAYNGIAVQVVKSLAGRSRPDDWRGADPLRWEGPFHGQSFYSGHTSTAFSVASVVAYRYRDHKWVPFVSYGLASIGGLQRIYQNRHWASDVVFGAMAGTASGLFLCKAWERRPLNIYPVITSDGVTMVIPIGSKK
jgi:membrane-associated phospholipid phosphatase